MADTFEYKNQIYNIMKPTLMKPRFEKNNFQKIIFRN